MEGSPSRRRSSSRRTLRYSSRASTSCERAASATASPAPSGTGNGTCQIAYAKTSEWPGGFTANITITNTGTSTITGWTLKFPFPGDQKITNAWNATTTQTGTTVTATNAGYNATITPAGNTSFGFQGTFTTNDTTPTTVTLNGTTCTA